VSLAEQRVRLADLGISGVGDAKPSRRRGEKGVGVGVSIGRLIEPGEPEPRANRNAGQPAVSRRRERYGSMAQGRSRRPRPEQVRVESRQASVLAIARLLTIAPLSTAIRFGVDAEIASPASSKTGRRQDGKAGWGGKG
jgi:hypothetical protein